MSTHIHVPPAPLSEFVDLFWLSEDYAPLHPKEQLMPSGMMNLVVSWDRGGNIWSGVSGVRTGARMLDTSSPATVFGVSFKPGGAFPFLPMPADELQDLDVPFEAVWGRGGAAVCEQLVAACTPARKFQIVEHALLGAARCGFDRHRAVRYGVRALGDASRPRPVARIVDEVGMSQRRFIELFRHQVGVTPKPLHAFDGFSTSSAQSSISPRSTGRASRCRPATSIKRISSTIFVNSPASARRCISSFVRREITSPSTTDGRSNSYNRRGAVWGRMRRWR
jgi:Bacterial regulatory helix-turn-helix proteins, AraC family